MKKRILTMLLAAVMVTGMVAGCGQKADTANVAVVADAGDASSTEAASAEKTYYYVAPGLGQPYCLDMHYGFRYAAEKYNCKIEVLGSDDWNSQTACEALEQVIAKQPDGIITVAWDAAMNPGIIKAQEAGIPVILVEAESGEKGDLYIGLDNVDAGRETADELVKVAGESGKLLVIGNWGSTNIDQKFEGLKEVLAKYPGWEIIGDQDGDCDAATSLQAAKDLLNNHKDATAFVGLDSACGGGIAGAMEELKIEPGTLAVVCADREDAMIEYIKSGYINSSLTNRTALMCDLAVAYLDNINNHGLKEVPITADNAASGVAPYPKAIYTGNVIINKDNADNFLHENMDVPENNYYGH